MQALSPAPTSSANRSRGAKGYSHLPVSPTRDGPLQALVQHPCMPSYLGQIYTEVQAEQRGDTVWVWDTASLMQNYQVKGAHLSSTCVRLNNH